MFCCIMWDYELVPDIFFSFIMMTHNLHSILNLTLNQSSEAAGGGGPLHMWESQSFKSSTPTGPVWTTPLPQPMQKMRSSNEL